MSEPVIGIQLPEGLRTHFREISNQVEKRTGALPALLAEMCCGACMAERPPSVDILLHFAHAPFEKLRKLGRIYFVSYNPVLDIEKCVKAAIPELTAPVGVLTTSTHAPSLGLMLRLLREAGLKPLVGNGKRTGERAVVLGCDLSAARALTGKAESFIFVGSGNFHPVGVELATGKKVVCADPYTGEVRGVEDVRDRILRKRFAAIEAARTSRTFGILLGLYPGQERKNQALAIRAELQKSGKAAYLLAARMFTPENVDHLGLDAIVSTACPRIAVDDGARYVLPVLTPFELEIVLGNRKWEHYRMDEFD